MSFTATIVRTKLRDHSKLRYAMSDCAWFHLAAPTVANFVLDRFTRQVIASIPGQIEVSLF